MLWHEASVKFRKTEIIETTFPGHSGIKLEIKNKKEKQ